MEEIELEEAIRPRPGTWRDAVVAGTALLAVVAASTLMERAATVVGGRWGVADIVTGALVLAVVTSLPNAVAAVYLAARGRGAAVLSTALNSNALNVAAGLLLPGAVTGLGPRSGYDVLVTGWYAGLTLAALLFAYRDRGLTRAAGVLIIAGYLVFVAALLASVARGSLSWEWALLPAALTGLGCAALLARRPAAPHTSPGRVRATPGGQAGGAAGSQSLVAGWSVARMWALSVGLCCAVAALDAVTGRRVILIGLLIAGPCCAMLTGRWRCTAATSTVALGLGVALGVPDGVFATYIQYAFLAAIGVVAVCATAWAALIEHRRSA